MAKRTLINFPVGAAIAQLSATADGTVWAVSQGGHVMRWRGSDVTSPAAAFSQISAGSAAHVWGVDVLDGVWRLNGGFTKVDGSLKQVSVAADGSVWGVNRDDSIFVRQANAWTKVPGQLNQISTGSAKEIWGVNRSDHVYRWSGNDWTRVTGALKQVSAAADGSVWGVNRHDEVYMWNGTDWTRRTGQLQQVSTGSANQVWGIGQDGAVFYLTYMRVASGKQFKGNSNVLEAVFDRPFQNMPVIVASPHWENAHGGVSWAEVLTEVSTEGFKTYSGNYSSSSSYYLHWLATGMEGGIPDGSVHIEHGKIQKDSVSLTVPFAKPFERLPRVLVSPQWEGAHNGVGYAETIDIVTHESFTLCSSNRASNYYVQWIAISDE